LLTRRSSDGGGRVQADAVYRVAFFAAAEALPPSGRRHVACIVPCRVSGSHVEGEHGRMRHSFYPCGFLALPAATPCCLFPAPSLLKPLSPWRVFATLQSSGALSCGSAWTQQACAAICDCALLEVLPVNMRSGASRLRIQPRLSGDCWLVPFPYVAATVPA